MQRATADAQQRLDDERHHGGLEPEKHPVENGMSLPEHVDERQRENRDEPRNNEQDAGDETAARAVE
jgi:hypothetical protein